MKKILIFLFIAGSITICSASPLQDEFNNIKLTKSQKSHELVIDINNKLAHVDLLTSLENHPTGNYLAEIANNEPNKIEYLNECLNALSKLIDLINPANVTYGHPYGPYDICEEHIHYNKENEKIAEEIRSFMSNIIAIISSSTEYKSASSTVLFPHLLY